MCSKRQNVIHQTYSKFFKKQNIQLQFQKLICIFQQKFAMNISIVSVYLNINIVQKTFPKDILNQNVFLDLVCKDVFSI